MRQAMVVIGGGTGSGTANSMTPAPVPAWIGAVDSSRGRMLHIRAPAPSGTPRR